MEVSFGVGMQREKILLSWSGGKDSAMTLHEIRKAKVYEVIGLVTAVCETDSRVTAHGVCRDLVEAQARAIGLPLDFMHVPVGSSNRLYTERLHATLTAHRDQGVRKVAFGDLYLDDIRDFREECLEALSMEAIFPLWHRDTKELSQSFLAAKFKAVITCVDPTVLDDSYVGRHYDRKLLGDLPLSIDPCGENGEFHTFVYDGPIFEEPVSIKVGDHYDQAGHRYCQIQPHSPAKLSRARSI
jgi:uncharacterized protein (TIGR00290 family)